MFSDLVEKVDEFVVKYGSGNDNGRMKHDLLMLIEFAIAHGEQKDQNKITGILVKGVKALFGKE
jgi:hypothetical protein